MKSVSKIIMLLVLTSFSFSEVVAQEKYPKSKGKVIFRFASPKDEYKEIYKQLTDFTGKKRRNRVKVLDVLADEINNRIVLPSDLIINFTNDGEGVAGYQLGTNQVVFGYGELLRVMDVIKQDQYREYFANDITQQELILGAATFTILHELHHFLFHNVDKLNIVLTAEEDWADVTAMQFMLSSKNELLKLKVALMGIFEWHQSANDRLQTGALDQAKAEYAIKLGIPAEQVSSLFSSIHHPPTDEHSSNEKRYYDLLSIFIGKYSSAKNVWSAFVRKTENEPTFFTQIEKIPFQNSSTQKSDTIILVIQGLNPKISQKNADKADYFFNDNVQKWKTFMGYYLKDNQSKLINDEYKKIKLTAGIGTSYLINNSPINFKLTDPTDSKSGSTVVFLSPKYNLTNRQTIGLELFGQGIDNQRQETSFYSISALSEWYWGKRRMRPLVGVKAGWLSQRFVFSDKKGVNDIPYKDMSVGGQEKTFTWASKQGAMFSPYVGFVFGHLRVDAEVLFTTKIDWIDFKRIDQKYYSNGFYISDGSISIVNKAIAPSFNLRFGIDIGGGKKNK